jgi:Na+/H+ antiporter NhaD/arsenite permease-like protein
LLQHSWIVEHRDLAMAAVFVLGYAGIIFEELIGFDKTSISLLMGIAIWVVLMTASGGSADAGVVHTQLSESIASISEILFFLIGAMTIVEIVDGHEGFRVVTDSITTNNRRALLWIIGVVTFFMSSCLDNLTSTIVMISLLRKLVKDPTERWLYGAVVVIAANAGGAWTPIGDLTTTLLWVNGNITPIRTITDLFLPSFISLVASLACFTPMVKGDVVRPEPSTTELPPRAGIVFVTGLTALLSVPVFKAVTGVCPSTGTPDDKLSRLLRSFVWKRK